MDADILLTLLTLTILGILRESMEIAQMANIILTAGLVLVTGFYAWQTWRMVKVMERQVAYANKPVVYVRPKKFAHNSEGDSLHLYITNGGRGPALHINAVYTPDDQSHKPLTTEVFGLNSDNEADPWNIVGPVSARGTVVLTYKDIDGREFKQEQIVGSH